MKSFIQYLKEETDAEEKGAPLMHLRHLEDDPIHSGHEGVARSAQFLDDVHSHLLGKQTSTHVSTKYDGAPSIVYGIHPKTNKFFVGTKSVFNKNPKINYTDEDIDANHGHAPGLAAKLKEGLQHLPKIMPRKGGVFQGDFMYGKGDVKKEKNKSSFTPNTITYSTPSNGAEGKKITNSKIGMVTHTEYKGKGDLSNMSAGPLSPEKRSEFEHHPDVNHIDPIDKPNPSNYTPDEQRKFEMHREAARKAYGSMKPEAYDAIKGQGTEIEAHINDRIKENAKPSVQGLIDHMTSRHEKEIAKLKTPAVIDRKKQLFSQKLQQAHTNSEHLKKIFDLHNHMQEAKNILTGVMAKNSKFENHINGTPTAPEGAVAVNKKGEMTKFVDRGEFSRSNFAKGKPGQEKKEETDA